VLVQRTDEEPTAYAEQLDALGVELLGGSVVDQIGRDNARRVYGL
jgi:hypothetical protein